MRELTNVVAELTKDPLDGVIEKFLRHFLTFWVTKDFELEATTGGSNRVL